LTNFVYENRTDWDEHLSTMLFSYKIAYKIATRYTPYQLVYGLHPLMPIEYIVLIAGGNERDGTLVRTLISIIIEFEKLQEVKMQVVETIGIHQWNKTLCSQQKKSGKTV
jgi:hypothetical protein